MSSETAAQPARPATQPLLMSSVSGLWTGVVGGPLAALCMGAVNLSRARRLRREWPVILGALVLAVIGYGAIFLALARPQAFPVPDRAYNWSAWAWHPLGAAAWGLFHLRLRAGLAAQAASREPWENPWNWAIAAGIAAWAIRLGGSFWLIMPR